MRMIGRQWSRPLPDNGVGRPDLVQEHRLWDERQTEQAARIDAALPEIDRVRVAFCDPHGLPRSKTLTPAAFRSVLRNGMDFSPGPFLFDTGHAVAVDFLAADPGVGVHELTGAGDFVVVPDPLTFQVLPGNGGRTAWVLGDEYLRDGSPHPLSTRHLLRRVLRRYADRGLEPVIGLEVEWYLTRLLDGPVGHAGNGFGSQGTAPRVAPVDAGYQFNLDAYADVLAGVLDPLAATLQELGLPLRTVEHESGPGQVEITFDPLTALDAADAMLLVRTVTKRECGRRGHHASFMALPAIESFDPSGWHLHQSVLNAATRRNIFAADHATEGLSVDGKAYVDGLLARARDYCLLSVPTVNGYRRLAADFTLAPTEIGFEYESRNAMVRVLGAGASTHLENRVGEPCANPYLAVAAQLSAGLDGVEGRIGEPVPGSGKHLPLSLREALTAFQESGHPARLLGEPLARMLAKLKESEAGRFEAWVSDTGADPAHVTEWEHREYFATY
uniref:Glutamine synthetase n=1 Tax=uncultured bacterium BAC AB649/1850 TaxID=1037453 RepID=F6K0Y9_9BACT|nr:glutamine synthetase [uncultured bacterium BAC AB649/1850]